MKVQFPILVPMAAFGNNNKNTQQGKKLKVEY
jgi:hypothetical protein